MNAWNGVIGVFTCDRARLATDAAVNINDHAPAGCLAICSRYAVHQWPPVLMVDTSRGGPSPRVIFSRARSDPLPVESVSFGESEVREFRLGKLRSLAYGVFQWSNCPIMTTVSGRIPLEEQRSPASCRTRSQGPRVTFLQAHFPRP